MFKWDQNLNVISVSGVARSKKIKKKISMI